MFCDERWRGCEQTVVVSVVAVAPGVSARLGRDTEPLTFGTTAGRLAPVRPGPEVSWPGTTGGWATTLAGLPAEAHPPASRAMQMLRPMAGVPGRLVFIDWHASGMTSPLIARPAGRDWAARRSRCAASPRYRASADRSDGTPPTR